MSSGSRPDSPGSQPNGPDGGAVFALEEFARVFRLVVDPYARKVAVDGKIVSTDSEGALIPLFALACHPGGQITLEGLREAAKKLNVSQAIRSAGDVRDLIINKPNWDEPVRECLRRWVTVTRGCLRLGLGDIAAISLTEDGQPSSPTNQRALRDLTFALNFTRVGGLEPGLLARLSNASQPAARVGMPREWTLQANGVSCRILVLACDSETELRIEHGGIFGPGETALIEQGATFGANPQFIIRVAWDGNPVTPDPFDPCEPYLPKALQAYVERELRIDLMVRIRSALENQVAESGNPSLQPARSYSSRAARTRAKRERRR